MTYCRGSLYRNNSCGCSNNSNTGAGCVCDNNGNCSCSNGVGGCNTSNSCGCNTSNSCGCNAGNSCGCSGSGVGGSSVRPGFPFPPRPSVCSTCPPGTFPCPCRPWYNYCNGGCGCNGSVNGCANQYGNNDRAGTFAFLNSSGTTLATGSIIPLRYVLGTGCLAKNTTGGAISLDSGTYTAGYSISGVAPTAGITVTVTPEYGGMLHPEFARSFTSSAAAEAFELSGLLGVTLPSDTTLSLNVTITGDAAADTTITGVNASMIINKICDIAG